MLNLTFFDTTRGCAIPNVDVEILKISEGTWQSIAEHVTNINGAVSIIAADVGDDFSGYYEVIAQIGNYFLNSGYALPTLKFIDALPIRFGIAEPDGTTDITIFITPYGYSFQSRFG